MMAGQPNPKRIKFEAEKKILDEVADEVACSTGPERRLTDHKMRTLAE